MITLTPTKQQTATQIALEAKIHSLTHLRLIELLADKGEIGMTEAAELIGISTAALTGGVDTLDALGFVERVPLRHDRRRINVKLTASGVALAARFPMTKRESSFA